MRLFINISMSNGLLELSLLNQQMNNAGIFVGCELRFYTGVLVYAVKFGPSGAYNMERFNRFLGYWESIMFSGTITQAANTLNQLAPFLTPAQIDQVWGGLRIPPEPPNEGFIFDPI